MHKLIDSKNRVLYVQRDAEALAILAGRQQLPAPVVASRTRRVACLLLLAVLMPLLLLAFVLFDDERAPPKKSPRPAPVGGSSTRI